MSNAAPAVAGAPNLATARDYLGLTAEQRYTVVSQQFPSWLLEEPITFPRHHPTYGWACKVTDCDSVVSDMAVQLLCPEHGRRYARVKDRSDLAVFAREADRGRSQQLGWALTRLADCGICEGNREAQRNGYCMHHARRRLVARRRGISEDDWRRSEAPRSPFSPCSIKRCVHDGEVHAHVEADAFRQSVSGSSRPMETLGSRGRHRAADVALWDEWFAASTDGRSVTPTDSRGE